MSRQAVGVLLITALTSCEARSTMARSDPTPPTGTNSGDEVRSGQPPAGELRRRCMVILRQMSPVGRPLTPEDERLAGMVERPGQPRVAIARLGRPHVSVDINGIILEKRCY
jgi:hypothetical protein